MLLTLLAPQGAATGIIVATSPAPVFFGVGTAGLAGGGATPRGPFIPAAGRLASIPAAAHGQFTPATGRLASIPAAARGAFTSAEVRP